jgi:hypothetical protein
MHWMARDPTCRREVPISHNLTPMKLRCKAPIAALGALCVAAVIAGCGTTTSTGSYKGESKKVAQTISNLQSDATSANASKVCSRDLAASVLKRLEASGTNCKKVLEGQLKEIDTYALSVESISVQGQDATAKVKSTWSGKESIHELSFVREGGAWKVSDLQ